METDAGTCHAVGMAQKRDHRSAHRTRKFFDGISAIEVAHVLLLHAIAKTQPETAKIFVVTLDNILKSDAGITAGARENLLRIRRTVSENNHKEGLH